MVGQLLGGAVGGAAMLASGGAIPPQAIGIGMGIGGGIEGMIKGKQADKLGAPLEDPEQRNILNQIQRKRRQLEVGTSSEYDYVTGIIRRNMKTTQKKVAEAAGGSVGATLQGFQMAQGSANTATNKLAALQAQQVGIFTQLASQQLDKIAQRKLDLQMWEKLQKMEEATKLKGDAIKNISGGLASVLKTTNDDSDDNGDVNSVSGVEDIYGKGYNAANIYDYKFNSGNKYPLQII